MCTSISLIYPHNFEWFWQNRTLGSIRSETDPLLTHNSPTSLSCSGITMAVRGFISLDSKPQLRTKWMVPTAMQWETQVLATWVTEEWRPTKSPCFPKYTTRTLEKRRKDCLGIRAVVWTSPPHSRLAEDEDHVLLTCSSFVVLGTTAASHNLRCSWLAHLVEMGASWQQCQMKWDPEEEGSVGRERCGRQAWVGMIGGDCWGMRDRYRRHGKESKEAGSLERHQNLISPALQFLPGISLGRLIVTKLERDLVASSITNSHEIWSIKSKESQPWGYLTIIYGKC